ncbi:hypothetical protein L3X38_006498 [Prunus dulcis]|uniref:Uncharacterized protein n=1 Tax=Prunus dulcis TaxID=3755 RepID=A0AAD4ZSY8_PRUDU|nr:hypothetical protein L3X38_006498 [Prunus dulcis]
MAIAYRRNGFIKYQKHLLRMLDVCGISKDVLLMVKEHLQDLQSMLRIGIKKNKSSSVYLYFTTTARVVPCIHGPQPRVGGRCAETSEGDRRFHRGDSLVPNFPYLGSTGNQLLVLPNPVFIKAKFHASTMELGKQTESAFDPHRVALLNILTTTN